MEILEKFKENGYFTAELYHLLAKKKLLHPATDILPSEYQKEMKMSTQERLQNLNNLEIENIVCVGSAAAPSRVVLSITPRMLVFQNFKPNEKIVAKFSVKNISQSPTFVNMAFKESSYFSIKQCGGQLLSRLAPGISVPFAVTFMPEQHEDYVHRVTFYTDIHQFVLPLIAIGPRPIFDFPDKIDIPQTPLKLENQVSILVHNVGAAPGGFTLVTRCPFSVKPKSAILKPNESIIIEVKFKTMILGEAKGVLHALLETGENFLMELSGRTHTVRVELEKQVVRFFDTYNTMMRQQTFKVINKSDHVLTYMCMKNDCVYEDFKDKLKLATVYYNVKESQGLKSEKLVHYDVLSSEEHERVYTRIFYDEVQSLVADESLLFQNMHFSITPIKGKLWPKVATELTITFSPKAIGEFQTVTYLDIDGVTDRVPLTFIGISTPPLIQLNVETLDMDCVYINKTYNYEIVAINKGHINGVIVYKDVPTLFSSIISCSPEVHCLRPGDKAIFVVSFCNSNQGPFFEEINFIIRDTDVVLKLYLKGEVIYPSLNFSAPCLDFGMVSVGLPKTLELDVINGSIVSVVGSLKISSDGPEISSFTLEDYAAADKPKPKIPQWPREFKIEPSKINIEPESRITLKVTLIANLIRANQTSIELELEKSDSPPIVLPVMYNALVPQLTPAPDIKLRACFVDFTYNMEIAVTSNDFTGYFTMDDSEQEESTLVVEAAIKEGYIEPNSTLCLPFTIKTSVLGMQEYSLRMNIFGLSKSIEVCHITGCGVRPIVTCTPMALHWGQVKLLNTSHKTLTLCNDSPVLVNFKAYLLNKDDRWQISPAEGSVNPESETDLLVTLYLIDANTYTNKVVIQLEKVKDILVPLSATGVGTSIIVGERRDHIVLGRHFTKLPLRSNVTMENHGTKLHVLEWSEHYKAPKNKPPVAGFFNLEPRSFKMAAGEKLELLITGMSSKVTTVKETWYLVGSVEGINKKELLMECPIEAEFVEPKLEVSCGSMDFQYDFGPYSELYRLTDIVTIKNVSKLPLDLEICAKPPFSIIQKRDTYIIPPEEENLCCCIQYRKSDLELQRLLDTLGPYESQTFVDCLTNEPVEIGRKGSLDFFSNIHKIKLAFNLTHMVEERLEDRDVMKLQILFDTTKHVSLKSKTFSDVMRIRFKGHKNKDAIRLIGHINYPNLLVLTPRIDFQCILNDSLESKTIKIQNVTPLLACYKLNWKKYSITNIPYVDDPDSSELKSYVTDDTTTSGLHEVGSPTNNKSKYENFIEDGIREEISRAQKVCQLEQNNRNLQMSQLHATTEVSVSEATPFEELEFLKERILRKVTPLINPKCDTKYEWIHKFAKKEEPSKTDINVVFNLVPHRGLLKPGETQYIQVIFRPKRNISVRGILELEVLGGPAETILVLGRSSDLRYKISAHALNFKIRSFHENAIEELSITNIAQLPFEFNTYLTDIKPRDELRGNILELFPSQKVLESDQCIEMQIVVRPGIVGYFNRIFLLEIGHLPPMPIEVYGWGVIPQIYLTLPRPLENALAAEVGYQAIQMLTVDYLEAVREFFTKSNAEHLNSPLTDKCFDDPVFREDWHICSSWDGCPSQMDIELAIERLLVINYVKDRPELLSVYKSASRTGPIHGFYAVPYVVDYGVVITGSTVQCVAQIINYGPIATKPVFAKGTFFPIWLNIKLCGKLNPGQTDRIEVTFSPTSADFTELEQHVETSFNLEVPFGVTIPMQIKALCAVPYLVSNVKVVDFGSVRCGDKVVYSIPLKNVGKPTCIWYVSLKLRVSGHAPMVVMDNSGMYEPDQGGWLSIAFKPTMEMVYEGLLIFRFHMNPNRMTIPVVGHGIVPHVHVIGPNVNFPPTLPWADTTYMYFGLTNPCPFPIELIIAHSDEKWHEEEEIYHLLYKYYNKPEEMLIPALRPGMGLPRDIINFYRSFNERVKSIKEEESAAKAKVGAKPPSAAVKKGKTPKTGTKTPVTHKDVSSPPVKFRTDAEIVADVINCMKENNVDPLRSCLTTIDEETSDTDSNDKRLRGFLVFVHGSPCEEVQCQEIAYSIGKRLDLPVINVDHCIVEALLGDYNSVSKEVLLSAINETYEITKRNMRVDLDEHGEEEFDGSEDEFELLYKKILWLANNKNATTPRSKISDKKKKKSVTSVPSQTATQAFGSTTLFHMDLVQELLNHYLNQSKFVRGFVVESLTSIVMKNPPLVLTTLLKSKSSFWNVHLILCQSDFNKWVHTHEEVHKDTDAIVEEAPKIYSEEEIIEIVNAFEEMDGEEFDNAPDELKAIYIEHGLEERRKKFMEGMNSRLPVHHGVKEKPGKDVAAAKSVITVSGSDSKKKIKKEDPKAKTNTLHATMNAKYNEYLKTTYDALVTIASNWIFEECDVGYPLYNINGQVAVAYKKVKKKSETHLTQQQTMENEFGERGFPLTLIMCPCKEYKEAVVNMLATLPTVSAALDEKEKFDVLKCPVNRKEYTVLLPKTFPSIYHEAPLKWRYLDEVPIKKCECNQLTDLNLLDDSTQDNVLMILSKWHCTCGKRMTSSHTSTSEMPSTVEKMVGEDMIDEHPLPLHAVKSMHAPSSRLILQPGDLVRCKYSFSPHDEGTFSVKRFVEVSGWPDSRVDINVTSICDLPRLDSRPKKMFANFVRRTMEDNVYKITYLDDLKMFEFGPIFVGAYRIYEEHYTIDLKNASLITADVEIEFLEETSVFQIDKTFIRLEPGCRGKLTISAAPAEEGVHMSALLFCVKDNPEIVTVHIACSGVKPIVEILPLTKSIDYGKLLLYRREDDRFIVKNDSILPVKWQIRNPQDFVEDFIISQTSGIVPRHDNQVVPVTYIACQVGVISSKILAIDIYDAEGRGEPMMIDCLFLSAECYDVMVECAYENPSETFLNYGNVKVNSTVYQDMYLLNRGKYNIYFKLKKVKNFPEPSLLKSFEAVPESGVIPASLKLLSIEFECTPTTSMNLQNVPAYTCSLLDSSKEQIVVAKFPVCVSIASFYNTFTLFPLGELNFHIIPVGTSISRDVILNNTSKCPVTYEIVLPPQYQLDPNAPPVMPKTKDNKIRNPPLKCGNFLIMNEDNLLAPGTSRTIQIQFYATTSRKFEETIKFVISDTCPAEAHGVPLRLVGTGAMPTLDLWNIETTFREHLIVKHLSDYKVFEPSPHCVFAENSVTLHFFCVIVNTRFTASIDLYNNGLVACALTMKLHYQTNSNQDIFSLDKYETHIEPLMHKNLGIIFTPKALTEYRAILEIKLKLLDNQEQSFKICLIGEGVIPRIQMVTPRMKDQRHCRLQLPVTCLGSVSNKQICFKNISPARSVVVLDVLRAMPEKRPIFWLAAAPNTVMANNNDSDTMNFINEEELNITVKVVLNPSETGSVNINYNPINKGRNNCDVRLTIVDNPYEYFTVTCEGEAFMEDVILMGLKMLPMETDLDAFKASGDWPVKSTATASIASTEDSKKKMKTMSASARKSLKPDDSMKKTQRRTSGTSVTTTTAVVPSVLKYVLDFGGCELCSLQRRSVVMVNNSEKVYKFTWANVEHVVIRPSTGYISPGEEKDLEIMFYAAQPVAIDKEFLNCTLVAISDDTLTLDMKGATWDNRQIMTVFEHDPEMGLNQRAEIVTSEQVIPPSDTFLGTISMVVVYSAMTSYTKYTCNLPETKVLRDTFIYQTRNFDFTVENTGTVPMKIVWSFVIDDEYPARTDKRPTGSEFEVHQLSTDAERRGSVGESYNSVTDQVDPTSEKDASEVTLFSMSMDRQSVDTWFEVDLPFHIEPTKACLSPADKQVFTVTFSPLDSFDFKVKLKSTIDNLDPYDQNISCKLTAKSLIPYVHLDIEESDYLTSGRRKITGVALPPHMNVLEFNVLGSGCYKKTFSVINPTSEAYEFIFEMVMSEKPELIPVHCNMLKGYVEGGTSTEVTFTFSPTAPGVYESQWKFIIPVYNLVMNVLVVGLVREPDVVFVPTILVIRNSLVGFSTTHDVMLKNNENEPLQFVFMGNSMVNESGKTPVIVEPNQGTLKPRSETPIKMIYTPIEDGPLSFKIFCSITYMTKYLMLCVNALSHSIKPDVTYYLIGNEHVLNTDVDTNIYLEQTASTYERTISFVIKNKGSATFFFEWQYNVANVKKYLQVSVEPRSGHVVPADQLECTLYFTLKQIPVEAFPVKLLISDGPEYNIFLYAVIEKPLYNFSCMEYDFGKCFINVPDTTYKKSIAFTNGDNVPVLLDLNFANVPELFVDYKRVPKVEPGKRLKISIFFRPKQVKEYEFKLQFWVNSLCEEILTIRGEGIPLLFDLYEGCQKSFDLGHVKVGEKIIRTIEVMNHSKIPIDATYIFREMYPVVGDAPDSDTTSVCLDPAMVVPLPSAEPSRAQMLQNYKDDKVRTQIAMDIENALSSLKVVPNKCTIKPFRKVPLKIQFKPVGLISTLNVQLNMKVFEFERPLVRLSGCATGMSLCFSQNSLQFGRVRKRGCKILKVMLLNKGNFGARFWWQPLKSNEFTISPQQGTIAAQTNVTFTITYRPTNHNPFVKVWASCNIENYVPLELALYATCVDIGNIQNKTMYLECPVREVKTDYVVVTNPTDDLWLILSESSGGPFETLREFNVEPNSTFDVPVSFKPKSIGQHECQLLYSPLGESALFVKVVGVAQHPNPNGSITVSVPAKDTHTEELMVYNITENPESYAVITELVRVVPDKFEGYYEITHPETIKTWGEATATCRWNFVCYEICEMQLKVMFINEVSREYQFYNMAVTVTASPVVATLTFVSRARESVQKELLVHNPLSNDSDFYIKCDHLQCPEVLTINRKSEAVLTMTYSPLVVGQTEEYLEVSNYLVGTFVYRVILKCLPAKEKTLEFATCLGRIIPIRLRVHNKTESKADFICQVSHASIQADSQYTLGPLEKGKFLVWFEPIEPGIQVSRITFNSLVAGEFVYNIHGKGNRPKPQGPYEIRAGRSVVIPFKNVFTQERSFNIYVDRDAFYVKIPYERIKPKYEIKVTVHLIENASQVRQELPTGTLTIETHEPPEPRVSWTYFLQGVP